MRKRGGGHGLKTHTHHTLHNHRLWSLANETLRFTSDLGSCYFSSRKSCTSTPRFQSTRRPSVGSLLLSPARAPERQTTPNGSKTCPDQEIYLARRADRINQQRRRLESRPSVPLLLAPDASATCPPVARPTLTPSRQCRHRVQRALSTAPLPHHLSSV